MSCDTVGKRSLNGMFDDNPHIFTKIQFPKYFILWLIPVHMYTGCFKSAHVLEVKLRQKVYINKGSKAHRLLHAGKK